uniref:Oxidation resistance 1 n=1 Tax=Colobus angolensis palliatus TaxID=336983 RepID=A0A2K5JBP3_COLAP
MDYLTTFTEKSGRLLRGTANRLWGFGGGGEARQVRFEDYLREPAQGDLGCGSPPHRSPAPSSPEGPDYYKGRHKFKAGCSSESRPGV